MLLTKHCRPEDRQRMLAGSFKIGTHSGFRDLERGFGDPAEGTFRTTAGPGYVENFTAQGLTIAGTILGPSGSDSFVMDTEVDFNVFCVSNGGYDEGRHRKLLSREASKSADSSPPVGTAWLVVDRDRLRDAMVKMAKELWAESLICSFTTTRCDTENGYGGCCRLTN